MTYYPKIAELEYKDKNISVKIPIRIKLIELVKFGCLHCRLVGTKTSIFGCIKSKSTYSPYRKNTPDTIDFQFEYDDKKKMEIPKRIIKSENEIYCPDCLMEKKQEVIMQVVRQKLFKLYITASPKFIDISRLVTLYTPFKWKIRIKNIKNGVCSLTSFGDSMDEIYHKLHKEDEHMTQNNIKGVKLTIFPIELSQLYKDFEDYEMRRVARKI